MKINEKGYWENETDEGHGVDYGLASGLARFFKAENADAVIDVGCGDGFYTNYLQGAGIMCYGFDGNPNTPKISWDKYKEVCFVFDFTEPVKIAFGYREIDWVLCLEVGEHIPKEYEQQFLDNLEYLPDKGIVLSWSIPEYGGDGHVNPQPNEYIISEMDKRGFYLSQDATDFLRNFPAEYPEPCYWFEKTLMVFRRKDV